MPAATDTSTAGTATRRLMAAEEAQSGVEVADGGPGGGPSNGSAPVIVGTAGQVLDGGPAASVDGGRRPTDEAIGPAPTAAGPLAAVGVLEADDVVELRRRHLDHVDVGDRDHAVHGAGRAVEVSPRLHAERLHLRPLADLEVHFARTATRNVSSFFTWYWRESF